MIKIQHTLRAQWISNPEPGGLGSSLHLPQKSFIGGLKMLLG